MESAPGKSTSSADESPSDVNTAETRSSKGSDVASTDDEANLIKRIRNGDGAAFRVLYDRYHRRAYYAALGVVKNPEDAQDVVQEAFIRAHRGLATFQGSSSFYTWLYRIVRNLAIDTLRRRKHVAEFDDKLKAEDTDGPPGLVSQSIDVHPGAVADRRELSAQIQQALHGLPEHHREVLILRESDGLSYEEIAELVQIPKGTVMSRLFHARKKMQAALAVYLDDSSKVEG